MDIKIPIKGKIHIAGRDFEVSLVNGLVDAGNSDTPNQKILICAEQTRENQESAVLHEVIEIINSIYDLNLEHQTIQTLEAALYHVYRDNF
jgi:hypothetical protein